MNLVQAEYNPELAIMEAVQKILKTLKTDPDDQHLKDTPLRVARAYTREIFSGYFTKEPKLTTFDVTERLDQMITIKRLQFFSTCAHHMLPFSGHAYIGYITESKMLGVSKFARIINWHARRLTVQEELTATIANYLMEKLEPHGVGVQLRASHSCMVCRGVMQSDSEMVTTALRGYFLDRVHVKEEWLQCIR